MNTNILSVLLIAVCCIKAAPCQESFKLDIQQPPPPTIHLSDGIYATAGSVIDLDALFVVEGSLSYEHQWSFWDGSVLQPIANALHTLSNSGVFHLTVVDEHGCTFQGSIAYFDATHIGKTAPENLNDAIQVYPNPNRGAFNIVIRDCLPGYAIQVVNLLGMEVLHVNLEEFVSAEYAATLYIPGERPGVYFLLVRQYREVVFTRKIVIMSP
jgi:hypothetical protein